MIKCFENSKQDGKGVTIKLSGDEVATAIEAYLVAHGVIIVGPRTIRINGELCTKGKVYVDPSGFVINRGVRYGKLT